MIDLKKIPGSEIFTGNIVTLDERVDISHAPIVIPGTGIININQEIVCHSLLNKDAVLLRVGDHRYVPIARIRSSSNLKFALSCHLSGWNNPNSGFILFDSPDLVLLGGQFVDFTTIRPYDGLEKTYTLQKLKQTQGRGKN